MRAVPGTGKAGRVSVRTTGQEYRFEDVHFDLNRSSIRPAETKVLDEAASQLKNDPMLRLNVEVYLQPGNHGPQPRARRPSRTRREGLSREQRGVRRPAADGELW